MGRYGVDAAVISYKVNDEANWWRDINDSPLWQDRFFHILAALYFLVAAVAIVQLVRIHLRVPEFGWTTQKVFHLLIFLVNGVRGVVFVFRRNVQALHPEIVQHILLDMPSLAFFTTYALLILFWAEIYHQARAESTDGLRPIFFAINAVVYTIQIAMWLVLWWKYIPVLVVISKMFFAGVSLLAALGFLLYGGRLFLMLQRFPVESQGRRNKLQEVCFSAFDKAADLDVLNHPVLNFIYYLFDVFMGSILMLMVKMAFSYDHYCCCCWAVGGDITFGFGPFHFAEVATKPRHYPVSSDTLMFTGRR
ncbi:hypothetical protein V6N11_083483 [Hibiscus sabdariffa]|uniref:THH1/TOM1/TOM3 domain-containing protein n=1 Tax=Hibiscus sabdariffa TaxID=183260 RepID=A0ABR2QM27_9ROSI